jgi:SHS2 domain-containing protein
MKKSWEHYSHTADMGIRGFGDSMEEAFAEAALAMIAVIIDPKKIKSTQNVEIACEQPDNELLLIDWLNNILYEMATRKMLFSKFEVSINGKQLKGKAWGEKLDLKKHKPAVEIKAATYSDLKVTQEKGKWMAQCIVDI